MFKFKFSNDRYRSSLDYVCFNNITFPAHSGDCPRVPWSFLQPFCENQGLPVFDVQNLGHSRCHWDVQQVIQNMLGLCFYTAFMFKSRPIKNYYFCRWCLAISTYFITLLLPRVLSHLMQWQVIPALNQRSESVPLQVLSNATFPMILHQMVQRFCQQLVPSLPIWSKDSWWVHACPTRCGGADKNIQFSSAVVLLIAVLFTSGLPPSSECWYTIESHAPETDPAEACLANPPSYSHFIRKCQL